MAYKRVTVREQTYPGNEIKHIMYPEVGGPPMFIIYLKNGLIITTTHPVTVVEEAGKIPATKKNFQP